MNGKHLTSWCVVVGLLTCGTLSTGVDAAQKAVLSGPLLPGGLVTGQVAPGDKVSLNGRPVRVSTDGIFLMGFGRDAQPQQTVEIQAASGFTFTQDIQLKKRTYKITRIDGLPARKVTPKPEDLKRIRNDNAGIGRVRKLDSATVGFLSGFQWPALGRISGVFGSQRFLNGKPKNPHNGVDIAAPTGAPVVATAAGRVVLVHQDMFYSGKTVMIDHGHGLSSVYIHMNKIAVKDGQILNRGDKVGEVGMTGRTTGPHLHWGVSLFGTHLDPMLMVTGRTDITTAE